MKLSLFEPFHDLARVLGAITRTEEQCVRCLDYDEVADTDRSYKFRWAPQKVSLRIDREMQSS